MDKNVFSLLKLSQKCVTLNIKYSKLINKKNTIIGKGSVNFMSEKKVFTSEEAKKIGEKLGVKWIKFDIEQFRMGMDVELEHGTRDPHTNVTDNDALVTGKIALAHLIEFPDYYTRLEEMENEAEKYWENK